MLCAKGVFSTLLQVESQESGIFGQISNYFGVVESNGRGMRHLHVLVWLKGKTDFRRLRECIENEPDFKNRMIDYLESVIRESIYESMHEFDQNSNRRWNDAVLQAAVSEQSDEEFSM